MHNSHCLFIFNVEQKKKGFKSLMTLSNKFKLGQMTSIYSCGKVVDWNAFKVYLNLKKNNNGKLIYQTKKADYVADPIGKPFITHASTDQWKGTNKKIE